MLGSENVSGSTIGIIGGADGPTAIFLSGPSAGSLLILAGLLALTAVGVWLYKRKRK